jgi:predicted DCC family thiol-disulfide oxidoreductase YuxK
MLLASSRMFVSKLSMIKVMNCVTLRNTILFHPSVRSLSHLASESAKNDRPLSSNGSQPQLTGQIDLLYDSECPLCKMEIEFLKKRDIYQRIRFTDISSPFYDPKQHGNVQYVDGMRRLSAVLPDNRVITGMDAVRSTYGAIGLGWIFAATKWPIIGQVVDVVYDVWAENRLRMTGRHDLAEKLKAQAEALKSMELEECHDKCNLDDRRKKVSV